jgi:hypothetical protein
MDVRVHDLSSREIEIIDSSGKWKKEMEKGTEQIIK